MNMLTYIRDQMREAERAGDIFAVAVLAIALDEEIQRVADMINVCA